MALSAGPGLFFCFVALVLLVFATVSAPIWESISFLNTNIGGREIHFGVFGYTGSARHLGYPIDQLNTRNGLFNSTVVHNLTYVLVLHPIAAGFAFLAVVFGLCGAASHRVGTIIMSVAASLATIITLVVWVIDMVLFGITRNKLRGQGYPAQYGNANWLVLGAFIALLLGTCTSFFGIFGSYRTKRANRY
ncbi:hypothetical protein M407DRAFT_245892 [Tulasnella calospora MUT 4182]|uniref:Pali-domain-containing protein n=1 Tax=Tulasnella calospora MUT 4182 TaxID=1051891 RepID=A0A0C3Q8V8_9AGAM|nr:hypothetical protein M407DRAFT_245892 [Tulasnella calospora MUT 4182]